MTHRFDTDPEALAWARGRVQMYLDRLEVLQREADERGDSPTAFACSAAHDMARKALIGDATCPGVFDERLATAAAEPRPTTEQPPLPDFMNVTEYRAKDGRWVWLWRCWGDGGCEGCIAGGLPGEESARDQARQHVIDHHAEESR